MPDTSLTAPTTPSTSVTDKKPDWFINNMQGFVPEKLNDMHAEGLFANNFSIEDPEAYWSKTTIKKAFTDENGKERRDMFDQQYKAQLSRYKTHRDTELNLVNFATQFPNVTAERSSVHTPTPLVFKTKEDPQGRDYQSGYAYTDPFSATQKSMKETAIETGVKNGSSYTPTKDFSGKAKFAMGEKGGLLMNEEGRPYLVPLKDGEQLHSWDMVYNPLSEKLGGYGYNYSWKNAAASIAKNPINFVAQSVDDLLEYGRGFLNFWGLDTKESDAALNRVENIAKEYQVPTTEKNEGSFMNIENVADMSQQVLYQLGAMWAVGATIGALTKNPKAGSIGAKLFMTAISAGSMAEVARDNGLSKRESAILLGVTSTAFYPLMSLSEAALGKMATKESRAALTQTVREATNNGILIKEIAANPTKASIRSLYTNLKEGIRSTVFKMEKSAPLAVGAVTESIEEAAEQAVDLAVRGGYNAYSYGIDDARHPFTIDLSREMAAMGQAAVGGAIGGTAAHTIFSRMLKNSPETANTLHDMVMDGKEDVVRDFVKRMHEQGRLDHDWLTEDGKITSPDKGNSKNDEAKNVMNGLVDYLVELRDTSGIKDLYKKNAQAAKGVFGEVIAASSVGKDAADLNTRIVSINDQLEKAKTATTPNTDLINSLNEDLKVNQEALQKIVKGDFVPDYVTEGLYNTLALTSGDVSLTKSRLSGKEFNALMNAMPEQHTEMSDAFKKSQEGQEATDAAATPEKPEGASKPKIDEFLAQAKSDYAAQHQALEEHAETLGTATEFGMDYKALHPDADIKGRNKEIDILKHSVLPAVVDQDTQLSQERAQNPKPAAQVVAELEVKRAQELSKAQKPKIDLSYITDKNALSKSITEEITDGMGNVETREISVSERQETIKKKAKRLEELADCIYGKG